jgi:hypothetical protein
MTNRSALVLAPSGGRLVRSTAGFEQPERMVDSTSFVRVTRRTSVRAIAIAKICNNLPSGLGKISHEDLRLCMIDECALGSQTRACTVSVKPDGVLRLLNKNDLGKTSASQHNEWAGHVLVFHEMNYLMIHP